MFGSMSLRRPGFTLVEFILILAIAALFIALGIPGYLSLLQNNKVVSATNKLAASISYARMEAIRRGIKVSLCPALSSSLSACGSSSQWSQGWLVFTDSDGNNAVNTSGDLLKLSEAVATGATVTSTSSIISFDNSGFTSSGAASFSILATGCTGNNGRTLNLSSSGRVSIVTSACP